MRTLALILVLAAAPGALVAQTTTHAGVQAAIDAYDAGEFDRAWSLLERLPASLPGPEQAVRWIYRGLIEYARGEADRAADSFARAVRADPPARLDPNRHSPNRVEAFNAARDLVVGEWRGEARAAEARGDTVQAVRQWAAVAAASPNDAEAAARLVELRRAQRQPPVGPAAGAPGPARSTAADSAAAAPPARVLDPGRAALLGLLVPGLGEIYTGRTGRGALILGTSIVAVGVGLLVEKVTIDCLSPPIGGVCPVENVAGERRERPYLAPGVGFAVVATLIGAVDAALHADRSAREANAGTGAPGEGLRLRAPGLRSVGSRVDLDLIRIRF